VEKRRVVNVGREGKMVIMNEGRDVKVKCSGDDD